MNVPTRPAIEIPRDQIADFCRRHSVRKLALFGSVLRDDFSPASDVDVLVEFELGTKMGLRSADNEAPQGIVVQAMLRARSAGTQQFLIAVKHK